jgi:hypothetical protein
MRSRRSNRNRWRVAALIAVFAIGLALFVWEPWRVRPAELFPDFLMFPSARTFDPPGTIFRINAEGIRFDVADISEKIKTSAGEEFLPDQVGRRRVSGETLASALGRGRSASLGFSGEYEVHLKLVGVQREKTSDWDVDKTVGPALKEVNLRPESHYYIIRETIAASEIDYTLSASDGATAAAKLGLKDVGSGEVKVERSGSGETTLEGHYVRPVRILYKLEEIKFDSSGINGDLRLSRLPITTRAFHWRESANLTDGH